MGQMRESLKSRFLRMCPLGMEKGEGAAIPTQGKVFAVIGDKGKWKLQRGLSPGHGCRAVSLPAGTPAGRLPGVTIRDLLVTLTYTTSWTLQNKAAHAQCPCLEAEMV